MNSSTLERIGTISMMVLPSVFTVGGTVWAVWSDLWYVWILVFISIFFISYASSYFFYKGEKTARSRELECTTRLAAMEEDAKPSLQRLQEVFSSYSMSHAICMLQSQLDFYARMARVRSAIPQGVEVVAFHVQGETLFAATKLQDECVQSVKPDDPFWLYHVNENRLETKVAMVVLHQPVDYAKRTGIFRIEDVASEGHLDALRRLTTHSSSVPGTQYVLRPLEEDMDLPEQALTQAADTVSRMAAVLVRYDQG